MNQLRFRPVQYLKMTVWTSDGGKLARNGQKTAIRVGGSVTTDGDPFVSSIVVSLVFPIVGQVICRVTIDFSFEKCYRESLLSAVSLIYYEFKIVLNSTNSRYRTIFKKLRERTSTKVKTSMILSKTYIQLLKSIPRSRKALEKSKVVVRQKKLDIFSTKAGLNPSIFCQIQLIFSKSWYIGSKSLLWSQ